MVFGAEGQNRTADTVIFSHVLYQLSYLGTAGRHVRRRDRRSYRKARLDFIRATARVLLASAPPR